jgi:hypothetical protein
MTKSVDNDANAGRQPETENPSTPREDHRLRLAAQYCKAGFRLLPTLDKFPPKGFLWGTLASSDLDAVRRWLLRWPECDLAIALPAHVVVVDVDVRRNRLDQLLEVAGVHPDQIDTIQAITNGGWHLWFLCDGHRFLNKHSKQYDGIETKTGGGYVVVPPAPGRRWVAGKRTMLAAPEWLKALFPYREPPPVAPTKTTAAHTPYGRKTLDKLCLRIETAPNGTQDDTRVQLAYVVGQYIAGGEMEENDAIERVLSAAAAQPTYRRPWNWKSVRKYTLRAVEKGMRRPRSWATEWAKEMEEVDAILAALDEAARRMMERER